jgi:hypothetical protein
MGRGRMAPKALPRRGLAGRANLACRTLEVSGWRDFCAAATPPRGWPASKQRSETLMVCVCVGPFGCAWGWRNHGRGLNRAIGVTGVIRYFRDIHFLQF